MHYQKPEYPLDYTRTEINQATSSNDNGSDSLTDRLNRATDETREAADKVAEQVKDLTERGQGLLNSLMPSVERSLKEQPLATLALVSVAAFTLGTVWKR